MEQRLAERFQAALADEPPLGFDPDEVADLAVSRQRRRGAVLGAATGTVALAIAAVALAGSSASQTGEPDVVASVPQVLTTTSVTSATSSGPSPLGDVDTLVKKLEGVIPQVLGEHAKPAVDLVLKDNNLWRTSGGTTVLGAAMVIGTPGHYMSVGVMDESTQKVENYDALGAPVSDTTNSDGSHTRVYRYVDPEGVPHIQAMRVQSNGVVVIAGADNALGVSEDMLVAIVNDPRLRF